MATTDHLLRARGPRGGAGPSPASAAPASPPAPAHVAAALALALALALAVAVTVFGALLLVTPHSETLEAVWWLAGFGVVAPLAALGARRLLASARSPTQRSALTAAAACTWPALAGLLLLVRATGPLPASLLLVALAPAPLLAGSRRLSALAERPGARRLAALAAGAAGLLGVAAFLPVATRRADVIVLALPLLALASLTGLAARGRSLDPRLRLALGIIVPVLLALLAWDVSFQPLASHQDFYLGPANEIRHGRFMLVDDYSQYGVTVIYFLSALLAPLPFGFGTFVLVLGILTAVVTACVYLTLRVATGSLALAACGTFTALMASSIATIGRSTQYPSTGFLRFGVPWLLVCALVLAYRREKPARVPLACAYALVAAAAIWSFETAFYTFATFAAAVIAAAWTLPDGRRLRSATAQLAAGAASAALAVAAFVTATELGRGRPPDLGGYLDFLRVYSVDGFGQLPVPGWSLGFVMGALCVASLVGVWGIVALARGSELARPSTVVPLAALSTFAAVSLTYFLGRSHPNNLTNVAPPFVALLTLWIALALRAWRRDRDPVAGTGVLLAALCAIVLVAQQLPQLVVKAPDSALAAIADGASGGPGLLQRLRLLADEPVIDPRTPPVEQLVRTHVPATAPLLVAVEPAVATETLIRLDRSDVLPIGTPEQDGLPRARREALVRDAARVPCGAYVVTQSAPMTGPGRVLLRSVVAQLRHLHPFIAVARGAGYALFRLGCTPA